ncbi:MAG: GNAT family N-acetyltransferase [Nitrospira sp.]|nr:GNAT family N-acetyltransferase [Nitrospira sp.]
MSAPSIRPYRAEDREAITLMLADSDPWKTLGYTAQDWQGLLTMPLQGREGFVVETNGAAAGLALLRQRFLLGDYLELLVIAPSAQGTGLGGFLLDHLERQVFARTNNLFVCVSDFNPKARQFYKRHGYEEIGPIPNLLIRGSAEILLRKTTGPARKG